MARRPQYFDEAKAALPDAPQLLGSVSSKEDVTRVVQETTARLGSPTISRQRRRHQLGRAAIDMPVEKVQEVLNVNVVGALICAQAVAPAMREAAGGRS
jgi:gluconate 5-dehydrogenase